MTIGEIGKKFKLTTPTLRYYESVGLIGPIKKNSSGIRDYSEADEARIEFICCMRNSGMSIEALKEYMNLIDKCEDTRKERKEILLREKNRIDGEIKKLQETSLRLERKIAWTEGLLVDCNSK